MGGDGAETKAVNCGEVGGAGVASMVSHVEKSLSLPHFGLVMGNPLTTPEGRRMSLLIPSKPATFTTHYSLHAAAAAKGGRRSPLRVVGASVMTRLLLRLLSFPFLVLLSLPSIPPSSQRTNEHRNIIATETTTSFIGKGREENELATFQRGKSPTRRELRLCEIELPG